MSTRIETRITTIPNENSLYNGFVTQYLATLGIFDKDGNELSAYAEANVFALNLEALSGDDSTTHFSVKWASLDSERLSFEMGDVFDKTFQGGSLDLKLWEATRLNAVFTVRWRFSNPLKTKDAGTRLLRALDRHLRLDTIVLVEVGLQPDAAQTNWTNHFEGAAQAGIEPYRRERGIQAQGSWGDTGARLSKPFSIVMQWDWNEPQAASSAPTPDDSKGQVLH